MKLYLRRTQARPEERNTRQRWLTRSNVRAFVTSMVRQGVFGRQRWVAGTAPVAIDAYLLLDASASAAHCVPSQAACALVRS